MAGGKIQLDPELLRNSIGVLKNKANGEVLEKVVPLANILNNQTDSNRITEELREACVTFQTVYNEFVDSVNGAIKDMSEVVEIGEHYLHRATVGTVEKKDVSFANSNIDASQAIQ